MLVVSRVGSTGAWGWVTKKWIFLKDSINMMVVTCLIVLKINSEELSKESETIETLKNGNIYMILW